MICEACRERRHGECRGGTWCDCQHKPPAGEAHGDQVADAEPGTKPGTEQPAKDDGSEPGINWLRQG
jgi:hypothetical protein